MKNRLLTIALAIASLGFMGSWSETKANAVTKANPQIRIRIGQRRHSDRYDRDRREYRDRDYRGYNNGYNNTIQTRIVSDGWRSYRETYQVRYLPNGRTQTVLISRQRVN
ncbi:MAG: hypothetical protein M3R68_01035 [Acidobacteriota bacterium]|nr:hypothetical protein [Acidobacteriota bacterium]